MTTKVLDLPTKIKTKRLIIRKYEVGDGVALFNLLESNGNRDYLRDYIDEVNLPTTEEEAEIRIRLLTAD